jgi:hypothetical protein
MPVDTLHSLAGGLDLVVRVTLLFVGVWFVGLLLSIRVLQRGRRCNRLRLCLAASHWFVASLMAMALLCLHGLSVVRYLQQRAVHSDGPTLVSRYPVDESSRSKSSTPSLPSEATSRRRVSERLRATQIVAVADELIVELVALAAAF